MMDKLFYNGKIRTLNHSGAVAQAVGVKDGRVAFIGTNEEAAEIACEEKIDLRGRLMLPGFVDSHLHMLHYAFVEKSVKLFDCTSVEDCLAAAEKRLKSQGEKPLTWLFCRGWNETHFDQPRYPRKDELDALRDDIPIIMVRVCGHAAVTNTCGLKRLAAIPNFSEIERDVDFETGTLKENAVQFFYSVLEAPSQEEIEEYILFGCQKLNEAGITAIQSDDLASLPGKNWRRIMDAFRNLDEKGRLTVRIYEQCLFERLEEGKAFIEEGFRTGQTGHKFTIGPMKMLQDGSLGAMTAALEEPYEGGAGNRGLTIYTQAELDDMLDFCDRHQMQTAIHCIGDRAMNMVIQAIEKSEARRDNPKGRHGIVHAQITNPQILRKMAEREILAYIQPVFVDLDMDVVEDRIGPRRMEGVYAWKSMLDLGIPAMGGSDAPVVSFDVLENLYFTVTRKNIKGLPEGGWIPSEKLDIDEAVKLFTKYPAYASYTEEENGTIELGKHADLVVLAEDLYEAEPDHIKDVKVDMTVSAGEIVYQR